MKLHVMTAWAGTSPAAGSQSCCLIAHHSTNSYSFCAGWQSQGLPRRPGSESLSPLLPRNRKFSRLKAAGFTWKDVSCLSACRHSKTNIGQFIIKSIHVDIPAIPSQIAPHLALDGRVDFPRPRQMGDVAPNIHLKPLCFLSREFCDSWGKFLGNRVGDHKWEFFLFLGVGGQHQFEVPTVIRIKSLITAYSKDKLITLCAIDIH